MSKSQRASDQTVFGHDLFLLMQTLQGQQWHQTLRQLEQTEPDLTAYIMNARTTIERNLTAYGCSGEAIRTTQQFVLHSLVLAVIGVRDGQRRLMESWLPDDGVSDSDAETKS